MNVEWKINRNLEFMDGNNKCYLTNIILQEETK